MARKILATDYDGTLNQGGIAPHVAEAIERFRAAGNLFGVVTGRDKPGSWDAFKREGKFTFDFVLALNGALALDGEGNILDATPIDGTVPCGNATLAQTVVPRICSLTGAPCGIAWADSRLDIHPDYPAGGKVGGRHAQPFESLEAIWAQMDSFLMLNTVCKDFAEAARVTAILQEEFGAWLGPLQNGICIDIPACGMDKGVGIGRYAAKMGVAPEDIWTAGDNLNDIAMLKPYHGCAMRNGTEAAKEVAEFVCGDIADVVKLALGE